MGETSKWETDADFIDPPLAEQILFKNAIVDEFIASTNKYFVVAGKGIGKTLLLKYKRHVLETSQPDGRIFLPTNHPFLDQVSTIGYPSNDHLAFLRDWQKASVLWEVAISLSALSYHHLTTQTPPPAFWLESEAKSPVLKRLLITTRPWRPSEMFYELVHVPISQFLSFIDKDYLVVAQALRSVHSGIYVFIDQLDQALAHHNDRALWISAQIGLLEGAWNVMRTNHHVKVYTSMRQEAYANYRSPNKNAIAGQVSFIKYSVNDLRHLVNRLVRVYESEKTYADFLGFSEVPNTHSGDMEEVFSYSHRHTLGRPRDFVSICSRISPVRKEDSFDEVTFKEIVNQVGGTVVVTNVFDEVTPLLHSLGREEARDRVLSLLPSNVLTIKQMRDVCRTFNDYVECPADDCKKCAANHPFCDLYNIGLLGVVVRSEITGKQTQYFLEPYKLEEYSVGVLPATSPFYFVHPALNDSIRSVRSRLEGRDYDLLKITVGQGCDWGERQHVTCLLPSLIAECPDPTIRAELTELLSSNVQLDEADPPTTVSDRFIQQMWRINVTVQEQFPHAAWAAMWYYIIELCTTH